ncbi:MAG: multidrug efflux RND transporter permease subunit [Acidobacteriota bacterium]|nr:multidrug efflux RND transporter permease subunit [Acidobacteriota bacterium]
MVKLFIHRPVLAIVLSLIITIAGGLCIFILPVSQYPEIAPPTVVVAANYTGASAETVQDTVAAPIEQAVNGVEGLLYMSSKSNNDGSYALTLTFKTGIDGDIASVNVQNRINQAQPFLPSEVIQTGISVTKQSTNMIQVVNLTSPNGTFDETFLNNYATVHILDEVARVPGVGAVNKFGSHDYAIRFWLHPDKMAQLGVTTDEVLAAIKDQNIQAAAGSFGNPPGNSGQSFQYTANVKGRLTTVEEFENIVVRAGANGAAILMKDVATTEMGAQDYSVSIASNGRPSTAFGVMQLPGANALSVSRGVQKKLEELSKDFPNDLKYSVTVDTTNFVTESIKEVGFTLGLAVLLVVFVVFLFLGSGRATLIPMLAVPVSLIGTFASFVVLGFSINLLTLFAMILAIGLVVDDAIVVVEAAEHHIEEGLKPVAATEQAMSEVSGPVIGIALVLVSVFVPVAFMGGITGQLYKQFALTLAVSVTLSAFVALTLTPALCALILKPREEEGRFQQWFNGIFERVTDSYVAITKRFIQYLPAMACALLLIYAATLYMVRSQPSGFIPDEDLGFLMISVQLPDAASVPRTAAVMKQVQAIVDNEPTVKESVSVVGYGLLTSSTASNNAAMFINLKPWKQREGKGMDITSVMQRLQGKLFAIPDAFILCLNPPPIQGLGMVGGFQLELQDRAARGPQFLGAALEQLTSEAAKRPELNPQTIFSGYSANVPQYMIDVDRKKAKQLGVPLDNVFSTMQVYLGSAFVNQFNLFGRTWRVYAQSDPNFRMSPEALNAIYVRGSAVTPKMDDATAVGTGGQLGQMVPLSTLVTARSIAAPSAYARYNMYTTAELTGSPNPGYSSGDAIHVMEDLLKKMPDGIGYEWTGTAYQEKESGGKQIQIFALALVFVFLVLAALYESWAIPFSVLLGVPLGVFGAFLGLRIMTPIMPGLSNDIYVQIGLVTLIGLAAKNAILIVEFAKIEREKHGLGLVEAALKGARLRYRPILMTSFAFVFGVAPMIFATGAGAASRHSLGTAVCFGMLFATMLGVFFIPALYVLVEGAKEKFFARRHHDELLPPPQAAGAKEGN